MFKWIKKMLPTRNGNRFPASKLQKEHTSLSLKLSRLLDPKLEAANLPKVSNLDNERRQEINRVQRERLDKAIKSNSNVRSFPVPHRRVGYIVEDLEQEMHCKDLGFPVSSADKVVVKDTSDDKK